MINKTSFSVKDPIWSRIIAINVVLFFIFLSDAILSYWVPIFLQDSFSSSFVMGIIMAFSSIAGLMSDFFLPQIIRGSTYRKLAVFAIFTSFLFSIALFFATSQPLVIVFLFAMVAWGIYYELLGFTKQQFVAGNVPHSLHAGAWAMIFTFRSLAYTIGPFLSGILLGFGEHTLLLSAVGLTLAGFIFLLATIKTPHKEVKISIAEINFRDEFGRWRLLLVTVWPIIILSIMMGVIDAMFWTTGPVFASMISENNFLGNLFVPAHMFPSLFVGLWIIKSRVQNGKKRKAEIFFLLSSLLLVLVSAVDNIALLLLIVLISGTLSSFAYPLVDAVYSNVIARMGPHKMHLIGLTNSATSTAYIIGPPVAGAIASIVGEQKTFAIVGLIAAAVSFALLFVTPKKLRLHQGEIGSWK